MFAKVPLADDRAKLSPSDRILPSDRKASKCNTRRGNDAFILRVSYSIHGPFFPAPFVEIMGKWSSLCL